MTRAMERSDPAYQGVDALDVMEVAENYNNHLLTLIRDRVRPGDHIVDFGAGLGWFAAALRAEGFDVTGVEPDESLRRRVQARGVPCVGSLDDVRRPIGVVYSLNVLEHIEDDARAVAAISDALTPGGAFLLYVPAFMVLFGPLDRRVGHFRRYRRRQLREIVERTGLRVLESGYSDSLGFFAALLHRRIGDESAPLSPGPVKLYDRFVFPVSRSLDAVTKRWFGKNVFLAARK